MVKIVHCADLHIGAPCTDLPADKASVRREEIKKSLTDIIDFCIEKSADALLICGDLFDTPFPGAPDISFVKNEFQRIMSIPVYISAGNHDFLCRRSVFSTDGLFGANVHIFPGQEHCLTVPEKNLCIWGKSYTSSSSASGFEDAAFAESCVNILCLHGEIASSGDYCAIAKNTLAHLQPDYCALGHIHSSSVFKEEGICCAYPGTPEGHGFDDDGDTGFIYAELSKDFQYITRVCRSRRKYVRLNINITDLQTNNRIIEEIEKLISPNNLYRIYITGSLTEESDFSRSFIESYISGSAFSVRVYDETSPDISLDRILCEESPRGYFLRELRELTDDDDMFTKAARIGLSALSGREIEI